MIAFFYYIFVMFVFAIEAVVLGVTCCVIGLPLLIFQTIMKHIHKEDSNDHR